MLTSTFVLRGRRGAYGTGLGLVALSTFVLRGRRGSYGTGLGLVVCLVEVLSPVTRRHFAWQAWHLATSTFHLRGRCGAFRHPPSVCVAGVGLAHINLRFAWQAWCLVTSTLQVSPSLSNTHRTLSHSFGTYKFVTHNSFTHNFVTHTTFHAQFCHTHNLSHTTLSHTHTQLFTHNFLKSSILHHLHISPLSFLFSPFRFNHFF